MAAAGSVGSGAGDKSGATPTPSQPSTPAPAQAGNVPSSGGATTSGATPSKPAAGTTPTAGSGSGTPTAGPATGEGAKPDTRPAAAARDSSATAGDSTRGGTAAAASGVTGSGPTGAASGGKADTPAKDHTPAKDGEGKAGPGDKDDGKARGPAGATPPPPPPASPPPRRGGFFPMLLGGILAAGIGAAAVFYLFPEGWQTADRDALAARVAALEDRPAPVGEDAIAESVDRAIAQAIDDALGPLDDRVDALEAVEPPDVAALEERLATLAARLEAAEAVDIDGIDARLQALSARIEAAEDEAPGPDLGPLERGLDALATRLDALEEGRADAIAEAADEAVRAALEESRAEQEARAQALDEAAAALADEQVRLGARQALTELSVAAESGAPVPDAVSRVDAAVEAPDALDAFRDGLPTLARLQADFPAAARRALTAAPVSQDAALGDRVVGFLRSQTGARSLAPRAGGDPDAVLSRAEAAVREGRIADALDELDALPPAAAAELADWRARAERRTEALEALNETQARLGSE